MDGCSRPFPFHSIPVHSRPALFPSPIELVERCSIQSVESLERSVVAVAAVAHGAGAERSDGGSARLTGAGAEKQPSAAAIAAPRSTSSGSRHRCQSARAERRLRSQPAPAEREKNVIGRSTRRARRRWASSSRAHFQTRQRGNKVKVLYACLHTRTNHVSLVLRGFASAPLSVGLFACCGQRFCASARAHSQTASHESGGSVQFRLRRGHLTRRDGRDDSFSFCRPSARLLR
jgi:hypothetical protein